MARRQEDGTRQLVPVVCGVAFGGPPEETDEDDGPREPDEYAAPEVLAGSLPTPAADMWSVGCVLTEVFRSVCAGPRTPAVAAAANAAPTTGHPWAPVAVPVCQRLHACVE